MADRRAVPGAGSLAPADHPPIALPDDDWTWFLSAADALAIEADLAARRTTIEALYGHLVGVNRWLNLTRIVEPREYLKFHLLDSLTLLTDRRIRRLREGAPIVDLGSGGGFPGLPLAMCLPQHRWVLVDSRRRKVEFLAAAASLLPEATIEARHFRGREVAKAATDLWRKTQVVVSRAAGPVDRMLEETMHMVEPHGHLVIAKGPNYGGEEQERAEVTARKCGYVWVADNAIVLEPGDPERRILIFERIH